MYFLRTLLYDFLYPPCCPICGERTSSYPTLCTSCFETCCFLTGRLCECCGYPLDQSLDTPAHQEQLTLSTTDNDAFIYDDEDGLYQGQGDRCIACIRKPLPFILRSPLSYNNTSKDLILKLKYADQMEIASLLGKFMVPYLRQYPHIDTLIPVPLHWARLWKRRYNQATLLCHAMQKTQKYLGSPPLSVVTHNLVRIKHTHSQGHHRYRQRVENMRGAFIVKNPKALEGKTIALIDDVYTTGATLRACARALQKAGAKNLYAFTVARVLKGAMM